MINKEKREKRNIIKKAGRRISFLTAMVVVFTTTYALILPAIAINKNEAASEPGMEISQGIAEHFLACHYAPHAHTDDCYIERDILNEDDSFTGRKEKVLVCGKADYAVHIHNDDCYDEYGMLVCPLPEIFPHVHEESCWQMQKSLSCAIPEHVHTEECYADVEVGRDRQLTCGYNEGDVISPAVYSDPVYSEAVYDENGELIQEPVLLAEAQLLQEEVVHHHTEECYTEVPVYERQLICGMEEHVHSDACYKEERVLVCGQHELHTHTEECYEYGPNGESPKDMGWAWYVEENGQMILDGDPAHRICGKLELLEHVHGDDCFEEVFRNEEVVVPLAEPAPEEILEAAEEVPETAEEVSEAAEEISESAEESETAEEAQKAAAQQMTLHAATDTVEVTVTYEEGTFPEGTTMSVTDVVDDDTISSIRDAAAGGGQGMQNIVKVQAADITFYDMNGMPVEPAKPVRVVMTPVVKEDIAEGATVEVVHLTNDGQTEIIEQGPEMPVAVQGDTSISEPVAEQPQTQEMMQAPLQKPEDIIFEASSFSVYALVYTMEITQTVLASDGHNYRITVTCDPEAGIPENAELVVTEITEDTDLVAEEILPDSDVLSEYGMTYDEYVARTEDVLGLEEGTASYIRLFDIKIVDAFDPSTKYQPAEGSPVDVKIELADAAGGSLQVVHFSDGGDEASIVESTTDQAESGQVVQFFADGFSIHDFCRFYHACL